MFDINQPPPRDPRDLEELLPAFLDRTELLLVAMDAFLERFRRYHEREERDLIALEEARDNALARLHDLREVTRSMRKVLRRELGSRSPRDRPRIRGHRSEVRVTSLRFEWHHDGSAAVELDHLVSFRLSAKLARLFYLLASGKPPPGDDLVPWKSRSELARQLQEWSGEQGPVRIGTFHMNVHRLRKAIREAGGDVDIVETHRKHGARIAYAPGSDETITGGGT